MARRGVRIEKIIEALGEVEVLVGQGYTVVRNHFENLAQNLDT